MIMNSSRSEDLVDDSLTWQIFKLNKSSILISNLVYP